MSATWVRSGHDRQCFEGTSKNSPFSGVVDLESALLGFPVDSGSSWLMGQMGFFDLGNRTIPGL